MCDIFNYLRSIWRWKLVIKRKLMNFVINTPSKVSWKPKVYNRLQFSVIKFGPCIYWAFIVWFAEAEATLSQIRYLHLDELAIDDIIWVDEPVGLHEATCHIEECKVIGLDCEWKPNYEKGRKNKVIFHVQKALIFNLYYSQPYNKAINKTFTSFKFFAYLHLKYMHVHW